VTVKKGFTLIEMMVACVIMTTALLGVYSCFKHFTAVEVRTSVRWNDRAAAEAIVAHLADTVEHGVILPGRQSVVLAEGEGDGGVDSLTCYMTVPGHDPGRRGQVGIQRRRYRWDFDAESDRSGTLELQTLYFAGTKNVSRIPGLEELSEEEVWDRVPAQTIGRRLDLWIKCKPLDDPQAEWQKEWRGSVGKVAFWIHVRVADETLEKIVVPRASTAIVAQEGG